MIRSVCVLAGALLPALASADNGSDTAVDSVSDAAVDSVADVPASAFPALPCPDGWAGCVVEGQSLSPQMVEDELGRPHPADMRYSFFDFSALPAASPFVELTDYPPKATEPVAKVEPRSEEPEREARDVAVADGASVMNSGDSESVDSTEWQRQAESSDSPGDAVAE